MISGKAGGGLAAAWLALVGALVALAPAEKEGDGEPIARTSAAPRDSGSPTASATTNSPTPVAEAPSVTTPTPTEASPTTVAPKLKPKAEPEADPIFGTCGESNSNGYGNDFRDRDSEYRHYDDRESDGIVCEF